MTTSGTTTFSLVATQIIEKAFKRLGVASEGEAISARMYEDARESLNLLVKAWGHIDHLWTRTDKSVPLVGGQAAYPLTPKPLKVLEVRRKTTASGIEVPLIEWAQRQYLEQPNKLAQSIPTAFYYDPQRSAGTLYVWPAPSAATAAATTLELTYRRVIEDFTATTNDADLPQEWLDALIWNLAESLLTEYPVNDPRLSAKVEQKAAYWRAEIEAFDTEPASIFLQPETRW